MEPGVTGTVTVEKMGHRVEIVRDGVMFVAIKRSIGTRRRGHIGATEMRKDGLAIGY